MPRKLNIYAVYRGEKFVCEGTAKECADYMGILEDSFRWYLTPSYQKRIDKRKKTRKYLVVFRLEGEE
jgi:hypothetical protein